MNSFTKFIYLVVALCVIFLVIYFYKSYKTETISKENILVVGTSADYPPFSFIENDIIVGFDIDIIKEIGSRLDKKIKLKDLPFDILLPEIQIGNIDVVAAGWTETSERAKRVLFTKPYLSDDPLLVITRSNDVITSLADLNGKEVVVNEGYTADLYMSNISGPIIKRLAMVTDGFLALTSGRVFAFIASKIAVKTFFDLYGTSKFNIFVIPNIKETYSLAITTKRSELLPEIQKVLEDMEYDGKLKELKLKWGISSD